MANPMRQMMVRIRKPSSALAWVPAIWMSDPKSAHTVRTAIVYVKIVLSNTADM